MRPDDYYVLAEEGRVTLVCPLSDCGWNTKWDVGLSMWTLNQVARSHIIEEHT